ncbi:MAG: hypothetical protein AB7Q37_10850 [Pyrinomonadaceae bacterium]
MTPLFSSAFQGTKIDIDLAEDPRPRNRMSDQLRAICQYACVRRETSIGPSILIIRFVLGFSPEDTVKMLRRTMDAIKYRLAMTRREINVFLASPEKLRSVANIQGRLFGEMAMVESGPHIQEELRRLVFSNPIGECPAPGEIEKFYSAGTSPLPRKRLAHLAGCKVCLERTALRLGIAVPWD